MIQQFCKIYTLPPVQVLVRKAKDEHAGTYDVIIEVGNSGLTKQTCLPFSSEQYRDITFNEITVEKAIAYAKTMFSELKIHGIYKATT